MISLLPGSSCDVCAEEYGRQTAPHSLPCGHILCYACCSSIVEKTPSRLAPSCPYCREHFTIEGVRLIRMDLPGGSSASGWSAPRKFPCVEANPSEQSSDSWTKKASNGLHAPAPASRNSAEVRRLESKVHSVANRKCSVEEVKTLKEELEGWLVADVKSNDQTTSLSLSAALLRAILMNHMAHSEASRAAKSIESNLKADIDDMQLNIEKLEQELRRARLDVTQKTHECHTLRQELARYGVASSFSFAPVSPPDSRVTSPIPGIPSPPPSTSTSPTPYSTPNASRYSSVHARSASVSASSMASRSATPSPNASSRSHTPAPRSHTPNPTSSGTYTTSTASSHARSQSLRRSQTPGPTAPPVPSLPPRHATPGPTTTSHLLRAQTPGPSSSASTSSRSRRVSQSAVPAVPKQMARSSSDETYQHQRWIPPTTAAEHGYTSMPVSRSTSTSHSAASRVRA